MNNNIRERSSPLSSGSKLSSSYQQEIDVQDDDNIAIGYDDDDDDDEDEYLSSSSNSSEDEDDQFNHQNQKQQKQLIYNYNKSKKKNNHYNDSLDCIRNLIFKGSGRGERRREGGIHSTTSISTSNYRKKNITCCIIGTLVFGLSIYLIIIILTRLPLSYIDRNEDYSDHVLTSYCAHSLMESDHVQLSKDQCSFLLLHQQHNLHQQQQDQQKDYKHNYKCDPSNHNRPVYPYALLINDDEDGYKLNDPYSCRPPVVSIIVPVYNTPTIQLKEMYESVKRQSLQSYEMIVVDDGSTNTDTIELINEWVKQDARVHLQKHSSKRGLPSARNTGIKQSRSPYIFLLDSDDMIEPTTLEKLVWKLETSPHIAFTKGWTVGFGAQEYVWKKGYEKGDLFLTENQVTITAMFRKEVFFENYHHHGDRNRSDDMDSSYSGFDEQIIGGMEDWDFILKCASNGLWGETVPEYMDWYRRKPPRTSSTNNNNDQQTWSNFDERNKSLMISQFKSKYPLIYAQKMNHIMNHDSKIESNYYIDGSIDIHNHLEKKSPRCLLILPWLNTGGADKFNLNFVKELIIKGWDVTIVTTVKSSNPWLPSFQKLTPDIFILDHFLSNDDIPRFLCYLIESRKIDITMISNSELGYLFIPYLKEKCPYSAIVDYVHMEEDHWKSGGYARYSLSMQSMLDLTIVSSDHLKEWMINRSLKSRLKQLHYRERRETNRKNHVKKDDDDDDDDDDGHNDDRTMVFSQTHHPMESLIADNIDVSYVNVDMKEFQFNLVERNRIREHYKIPMSNTVILFAGRLVEQKQPMVALKVFKNLIEQGIVFNALVVGDGDQRDAIEEFVQRNGMQSIVKILGDVPSEDMPSIISASDIVFLPSAMEGISMLFFESMAAGVIPIGRKIGGQHELITSDEGELISFPKHRDGPEYTVPAYTQRLKHLIQLSPKEKKEKSLACINRIATYFTIEMMSESIIKSFCKASYRKRMKDSLMSESTSSLTSLLDYPITHNRRRSSSSKRVGGQSVPMSGFGDDDQHSDHQPTTRTIGLHNVGVGQELAIQAIESMKWQKKSDEMWKTLEALKKQVNDDKSYHNQCDIDKVDGDSLKIKYQQLETSYNRLKLEFDQYVRENENLYSKYQDALELLKHYQKEDNENDGDDKNIDDEKTDNDDTKDDEDNDNI